ncbi:amidohydrolase family protein [Agrobacterium rosae]|uniref:amidohydrolase family protein n=1 Tax=Agrobacterium rosae TaxID=1972867 RepID=UPI0020340044|nr:amidohydrolase family protein [Agrobacterium rosae]MCM2435933.1 amidohydrolase family protein [Agrobacterium rosae]
MRCDSHVHVVASVDDYPQIPGRTFLAQSAPLETLVSNGRPHGIDHFVITQPSFYGTDNTVLLDALDALQGRGSGVIVAEPGISTTELSEMKARGASGLRVNIYSPAAQNIGGGTDDLKAITELAADHGMHVEIIAPLAALLVHADFIRSAGVPTVIDHYGLYGKARPDDKAGSALLHLLENDHLWMKLSSPYRQPDRPQNIEPDGEWLAAFLATCPQRCVWGSDWPHPPPHDQHQGPDVAASWRALSYSGLIERFLDAVGSPHLIEEIMWRNPAKLYGFGAAGS